MESKDIHIHTIVMKGTLEELTYSSLVDKLYEKLMLDRSTKRLKLGYIPLREKRHTYISDDEDLFGYLMEGDKNQQRDVLHVEVMESVSENQICAEIQREDQGSGICLRTNVITSDARVDIEIEALNKEAGPQEPYLILDDRLHISVGENDPSNVDNNGWALDVVENVPDVPEDVVVNHEWEDGIGLVIGKEFDTKEDVKDLVDIALHRNCFQVDTIKSTPTLYVLKCQHSYCKWSLRVARATILHRWSVRTYKKIHTCSWVTLSTSRKKRRGTPRLVAAVVREDYPGVFDTPTPRNLISLVKGRLGLQVSYSTAWRGKKQVTSDVRGTPKKSYMWLPSYLYMLEKMNQGTVTQVKCNGEGKFKDLFIALGACIEGFQAMRKVIIIDGTHLSGKYGGVLIIATAQDPDRHHYPLAFGVVDGEKDASLSWFLNMLRTVVPDDHELVFVSDRNASIIKMVSEVYPNAKHGYCIWHLSHNVKGKVVGKNKEVVFQKFIELAKVYTEAEFLTLYQSFTKLFPKADEYLGVSVRQNKWTRCYFSGGRYNIDTTTCCESLNGVFKTARTYSYLPLLDAIVRKISEWSNKYRKMSGECSTSQVLVPFVASVLHKRCENAKKLSVIELNSYFLEYNVIGRDGTGNCVDLEKKTCSCRQFDVDKYPCEHAIAAGTMHAETSGKEFDLHVLCSKYYFLE